MKPGDLCLTCSQNNADINYFRNSLFQAVQIPKEFLSHDDSIVDMNVPCVLLSSFPDGKWWWVLADGEVSQREESHLSLINEKTQ